MSRNTVKSRLKALVDQEDKKHPCSDEQLAKLLEAEGMAIPGVLWPNTEWSWGSEARFHAGKNKETGGNGHHGIYV